MNNRVCDLRITRHQPILHDVRQRVRVRQMHIGRQPDVQVEEHVIARSPCADLMAPEHAGHAEHNLLEV